MSRTLALAGLVALCAAPGVSQHQVPAVGPAAQESSHESTSGVTSLGSARLGDQSLHRVKMKFAMRTPAMQDAQEVELSGELKMTVVAIEAGAADVLYELSGARVKVSAPPAGGPPRRADRDVSYGESELSSMLSRRFFVSRRENGSISAVRFAKDMNPAAANLLMVLATSAQFVRGARSEPAWIVTERDPNGEYNAAYQQLEPGHFRKRKAQYLRVNPALDGQVPGRAVAGAAAPQPSMRIASSESEFEIDSAGRVIAAKSRESLALEIMQHAFEVAIEVDFEPGRFSSDVGGIAALVRTRDQMESRPLAQFGLDPKNELLARDRAALRGADFDDLAKRLAALPPPVDKESEAEGSLKRAFQALFRQEPDTAARAPTLVRSATPGRGKLVVDALSLASGSQAQSALASIAIDASVPFVGREYALRYLAHQPQPSEAVIKRVATLLDDPNAELRQMARFTYGAFAHSDPAQAKPIASELLSRLDRAQSPAERLELVTALGNAGATEALPALRHCIQNGELQLRTRAIESLRFIDDPSIDPLLESILSGRESESLRVAAINALKFRRLGPFTATLAEMAEKDPSSNVRKAAIDLLGSRLSEFPALAGVLERVRAHEPAAQR